MTDTYFNWVIEDVVQFVKAIQILGEKDNRVPLVINGTCISSMVEIQPKKKKKKVGIDSPIIFRAHFPRCNLPKFAVYSKVDKKYELLLKKSPEIIIGLDKSKIVEKMGTIKPKESITLFTKKKEDYIYYSIEGSEEKFNPIIDLNYENINLPKIKFPRQYPIACLTKEEFQKLCANIKRYKNADINVLISQNGLIIKATEYGTDITAKFPYGIIGDEIDSMLIDVDGFLLSNGNIDKMCNQKSIVRMYANRDDEGKGYFLISLPIGSSGSFEIYCPAL